MARDSTVKHGMTKDTTTIDETAKNTTSKENEKIQRLKI